MFEFVYTYTAMKQILFFSLLLLNLSVSAQTDKNISVVSADRLNIVYRGVPNPIKVAYPGADSLIVSAPGLKKVEGRNNYVLTPGQGNEVTLSITAILPDGNRKSEKKIFRIKGLPAPVGAIYGNYFGSLTLTKQELKDAVVEISMQDFLFDVNMVVRGFTIGISGKRSITIEGNTMSLDAIKMIDKLKKGQQVIIDNILYGDPLVCRRGVAPIVVEVND
jgi:gliding motility-associated protein GldM